MHIENLSLQSLARTYHGVGVHDLREALEGRGSMSNIALNSARPSSIRTLDPPTATSTRLEDRPDLTRSRSHNRTIKSSPSDVRDVLNKLGVGKYNGSSLLKASFPALRKPDARCVLCLHKVFIFIRAQIPFDTSLFHLIFHHGGLS